MSAPLRDGTVHLLTADDSLAGGNGGTYLALCGALVPASSPPPACCPPECDCAPYCPECVRVIACWHAEAGQAGGAR